MAQQRDGAMALHRLAGVRAGRGQHLAGHTAAHRFRARASSQRGNAVQCQPGHRIRAADDPHPQGGGADSRLRARGIPAQRSRHPPAAVGAGQRDPRGNVHHRQRGGRSRQRRCQQPSARRPGELRRPRFLQGAARSAVRPPLRQPAGAGPHHGPLAGADVAAHHAPRRQFWRGCRHVGRPLAPHRLLPPRAPGHPRPVGSQRA